MDNSWLILVIVLLAAVLGVMLRNRFFAAGTPFRRWTDSRLGPLAAKAAKIFCFATLAIWLDEHDPEKPKTRAFLDRRIDNVMQIEKAKAQWRKATSGLPDLTALAARLRYGPGRRT